jgi:hypothetical protein
MYRCICGLKIDRPRRCPVCNSVWYIQPEGVFIVTPLKIVYVTLDGIQEWYVLQD